MVPPTDTELLYHTLDLYVLVRTYSRHLQDESMLAKLTKDDVIIHKAEYHIEVSCKHGK